MYNQFDKSMFMGYPSVRVQDFIDHYTKVVYTDNTTNRYSIRGGLTADDIPHSEDIRNIRIGNSVTDIASSAFQGCVLLESAVIPSSVEFINENAFSGCSALSSV